MDGRARREMKLHSISVVWLLWSACVRQLRSSWLRSLAVSIHVSLAEYDIASADDLRTELSLTADLTELRRNRRTMG
jgi:hypothetical protein